VNNFFSKVVIFGYVGEIVIRFLASFANCKKMKFNQLFSELWRF
jgi:hypothetical protein